MCIRDSKRDPLIGLKENVIIGKKIPAGTGLVNAEDVVIGSQVEMDSVNLEENLQESEVVEVSTVEK